MSVGPTRSKLIRKGMIYSPQHGGTAFTVPLFDPTCGESCPNSNRSKPDVSGPAAVQLGWKLTARRAYANPGRAYGYFSLTASSSATRTTNGRPCHGDV